MRHMTKESMNNNQSSEIAHKSKKDELKSTLSGKICYFNSDRFEPRSHFVSTLTMIVRVSVVSSQAFDSEDEVPHRLSKRQWLSTSVLFRTTFTRTIMLNLLNHVILTCSQYDQA